VGANRIGVTAVDYDLRSRTVQIAVDGPTLEPPPAPALEPYVQSELDARSELARTISVPEHAATSGPIAVRIEAQVGTDASVLRTADGRPVLVAHVVLIQLDRPPRVIPTPVPVQQVTRGDGTIAFNAVYTVDLSAVPDPLEPAKYLVFLDVGPELLGPLSMTLSQ
jgi:hypothetical protein